MSEKKIVRNEITINAPLEVVWDWMVSGDKTKQYMFGCETVCDWEPGSPLLWVGEYEGKEMTFVSGFVVEIEEPELLVYSVIDPNAAYEKTPENHLRVTYKLDQAGDATRLTVLQDGFEEAADGEKRFIEVSNNGLGWQPLLDQIKKLVEAK